MANAIRKYYLNLGYTHKKSGIKPLIDLVGLEKHWYYEGYDSIVPFWDFEGI